MSTCSSTSSFSDCSMPSLEDFSLDRNGYEFVYSLFRDQGNDTAYGRLTPTRPINVMGVSHPNDTLEVIRDLEDTRVSDLFKIMVTTNRVQALALPNGTPPGTMQFITDQATVMAQDSIIRDVPRIGNYRALITLIPREEKKTWVGARVVRREEKELELQRKDEEVSDIEDDEDDEEDDKGEDAQGKELIRVRRFWGMTSWRSLAKNGMAHRPTTQTRTFKIQLWSTTLIGWTNPEASHRRRSASHDRTTRPLSPLPSVLHLRSLRRIRTTRERLRTRVSTTPTSPPPYRTHLLTAHDSHPRF